MALIIIRRMNYEHVLDFVREYQCTHKGLSPTRKEIADTFDISQAAARMCVEALAIRGKLIIHLTKRRGLELVE